MIRSFRALFPNAASDSEHKAKWPECAYITLAYFKTRVVQTTFFVTQMQMQIRFFPIHLSNLGRIIAVHLTMTVSNTLKQLIELHKEIMICNLIVNSNLNCKIT
jgi:hypothetical protein